MEGWFDWLATLLADTVKNQEKKRQMEIEAIKAQTAVEQLATIDGLLADYGDTNVVDRVRKLVKERNALQEKVTGLGRELDDSKSIPY